MSQIRPAKTELIYSNPESDIASFANQMARAKLYDYSRFQYEKVLKKPIAEYNSTPSVWLRGAELLSEFVPADTQITDVATGSGNLPLALARDFGFRYFSCYDIHIDNCFLAQEQFDELNQQLPDSEKVEVDFSQWDHDSINCDVLPAADDSLPVITSGFNVYHMVKYGPTRFIQGLFQKAKPGGYVEILGRNVGNHDQLWADGRAVAEAIGATLDPIYYSNCDVRTTIEIAAAIGFGVVAVLPQQAELWIPVDKEPGDEAGWLEWREALKMFYPSMANLEGGMAPQGSALQKAIDEIAKPRFLARAAKYGTTPTTEAEAACRENQAIILLKKPGF